MMLPVRAGREIPAQIRGEIVQIGGLPEVGRFQKSLPRLARVAGRVANSKSELIGVADFPSEIAGERSVAKTVIRSLAVAVEIRNCGCVIKSSDFSAQICFFALRIDSAAFAQKLQPRLFGCAAPRKDLHHSIHSVGTKQRARSAVNDFNLVDIRETEVGEIDVTAGF